MNDFTKKDLEHLRDGISVWIGETNFYPSELPFLVDKIQSMIDNYCEHHLINYCCGCDPENIVCDKCHRDLWGHKLNE